LTGADEAAGREAAENALGTSVGNNNSYSVGFLGLLMVHLVPLGLIILVLVVVQL